MQLTNHEKDVIRRVLGDDGVHLIEQEPGLNQRGTVTNDDTIAALTNAEAARVLQACLVGMAISLDDFRTLAERASAVGRELMGRTPGGQTATPHRREAVATNSSVANTRRPKRRLRNYDNVSERAKNMILDRRRQGVTQRLIVEELNKAGELIDGTRWDVTTMNNYYTTRLKQYV